MFKLIKKSGYDSHLGVCDDSVCNSILSSASSSVKSNIDLALKYLTQINKTTCGSYADVTLFVYDNIGEYPVCSIPGVMLPLKHFVPSCEYDEYRFFTSSGQNELQSYVNDSNQHINILSMLYQHGL